VEVNVIISASCRASECTICRFGNTLVMPRSFASKWHCLERSVSSPLFISSYNNKNNTFKINITSCARMASLHSGIPTRAYYREYTINSRDALFLHCCAWTETKGRNTINPACGLPYLWKLASYHSSLGLNQGQFM
jgi:hypothetical protein